MTYSLYQIASFSSSPVVVAIDPKNIIDVFQFSDCVSLFDKCIVVFCYRRKTKNWPKVELAVHIVYRLHRKTPHVPYLFDQKTSFFKHIFTQ